MELNEPEKAAMHFRAAIKAIATQDKRSGSYIQFEQQSVIMIIFKHRCALLTPCKLSRSSAWYCIGPYAWPR
jgi:hypothetical protein